MRCLALVIFIIINIGHVNAFDSLPIHKIHMELGGTDKAIVPSIIVFNREKQEFLSKQQVAVFLNLAEQEIKSKVFSKYFIELPKRKIAIKELSEYVPNINSCISYCIFHIKVPHAEGFNRDLFAEVEITISDFLSRKNDVQIFEQF